MNAQEEYKKKYKQVFDMSKADLLYLIENLMQCGKIHIEEIAVCHTKALEKKIAEKQAIIDDADNCIFKSVFRTSIAKSSKLADLQEELSWLEKYGNHNMQGINEYLKSL